MTISLLRRLLPVMACAVLGALLVACGPSSPAGRWQQEGNPNAGLEIREGGQFQGELGATGNPRVRLEGTWKASGTDVTFTVGGALGQSFPNLVLEGKMQGDVMTITPPSTVPGLTGTITLRKQAAQR